MNTGNPSVNKLRMMMYDSKINDSPIDKFDQTMANIIITLGSLVCCREPYSRPFVQKVTYPKEFPIIAIKEALIIHADYRGWGSTYCEFNREIFLRYLLENDYCDNITQLKYLHQLSTNVKIHNIEIKDFSPEGMIILEKYHKDVCLQYETSEDKNNCQCKPIIEYVENMHEHCRDKSLCLCMDKIKQLKNIFSI